MLAVALVLAVVRSRQENPESDVHFVVTHVEARAGDVLLGLDRLVELTVRVPDAAAGHARWSHTVVFSAGTAPPATPAVRMPRPTGVDHVEVACKFELMTGMEPVRTAGRIPLPPYRDQANQITLDVGACGEPIR